MGDTVTHQTGTPWVAYRLMQDIYIDARRGEVGKVWRSKDEILDLYAECFEAVTGGRPFRKFDFLSTERHPSSEESI